ncbi:MAG: 50S ribosomal protein L25 [Elusimicrobiota bacterium]
MSDEMKLNADIRKELSSSSLNEMRKSERIPGILYGPDVENTAVSVDEKEFKSIISTEHGENVLIKLKAGTNKGVTVLIKEIQVNPITMKINHIDFCQINLSEKIEVEVPLEVKGEAPGVKTDGGVLEHIIRSVKVKCLPTNIPDKFVLDISGLGIGDGIKIKDIPLVEGVTILADQEALAVNLVPPTELEEPEEGKAEDTAAEPEVIGEKKEEGAAEDAGTENK